MLMYTLAVPFPSNLAVPPAVTETTTHQIAVHDTGYTEIETRGNNHVRFALQPMIPPPLADMLPGPALRFVGEDQWVPKNSTIVELERECKRWSEGWEWRRETCNGIVTEAWWVGEHAVESFARFLKACHSE